MVFIYVYIKVVDHHHFIPHRLRRGFGLVWFGGLFFGRESGLAPTKVSKDEIRRHTLDSTRSQNKGAPSLNPQPSTLYPKP